ncbi:MAG: transporter substrate-binding domain-containing protein [Gemmatimonadales bacterium]|nr:MAG: transporter substrate-binding domain-containing protein [Gemmatimonadales bacterium]
MTVTVTPALRQELAPTGTLRVALNLSNALLVSTAPPDGEPTGVAPDIGRELARRLGVPVAFVRYPNPGDMVAAASTGAWDVGLIGADPLRASEIVFTPSYCEIEASYLVPAGSPIQSIDEVDRPGIRIAVADKTAYDMHLRRTLKHATLNRAPGGEGSYQLFLSEKLDALAGLRAVLANFQVRLLGSRLLEGRFHAIQQAIGTPIQRTAAAAYLREFVQDLRAGLAAQLIARHGVSALTVPATRSS